MVAEDRNLLHPDTAKPEARKLYAEGYGLTHLRAQAARAASWDKHHDRFETIKIVFRALAHDSQAEVRSLAALGSAVLAVEAHPMIFDDSLHEFLLHINADAGLFFARISARVAPASRMM